MMERLDSPSLWLTRKSIAFDTHGPPIHHTRWLVPSPPSVRDTDVSMS